MAWGFGKSLSEEMAELQAMQNQLSSAFGVFGQAPMIGSGQQYANNQTASGIAMSLQGLSPLQQLQVATQRIEHVTTIDTKKLEALKSAEPRKTENRVPDLTEVITAWRAWKVVREGDAVHIASLGGYDSWKPKEVMAAHCRGGKEHHAPSRDCNCGAWAFKSLENLLAAIQGKYQTSVVGKVSLWGRVIETENGYRAQFAYPAELWLFDNSLEELGRTYNVKIRTA